MLIITFFLYSFGEYSICAQLPERLKNTSCLIFLFNGEFRVRKSKYGNFSKGKRK